MLEFPQNDWSQILSETLHDQKILDLFQFIDSEYQNKQILPTKENIFNAFKMTPYAETKVVILGQDPYPDPKNAMGLSFSVKPGGTIPRSLNNMYKERYADIGLPPSKSGDLTHWAKQGVLLLNTRLTVIAHKSNSHKRYWDYFTQNVIEALNNKDSRIVFVLWGNSQMDFAPDITNPLHRIVMSSHPSPFSANKTATPFMGSKPFSKVNNFLLDSGQTAIDWSI